MIVAPHPEVPVLKRRCGSDLLTSYHHRNWDAKRGIACERAPDLAA